MKHHISLVSTLVATMVAVFMLASCSEADTLAQKEQQLHKEYLDLSEKNLSSKDGCQYDQQIEQFFDRVTSLIKTDTATFTHEFDSLTNEEEFPGPAMRVVTATDGKLRVYSLSRPSAKDITWWYYTNLVQYRGDDGQIHTIEDWGEGKNIDEDPLFRMTPDQIFEFDTNDGGRLYVMAVYQDMGMSYATLITHAYLLKDNELKPAQAIGADGKFCQRLNLEFNYPQWDYDKDDVTSPLQIDKANNVLYIPEISDDDDTPTDRYRYLKFNGQQLVEQGKGAGFWLHPSLRKFKHLEFLGETKSWRLRIDKMDRNTYRYTSWKQGAHYSDKPQLVINGGKMIHESNNRYFGTLQFLNDGYEYLIRLEAGNRYVYPSELVVRKGGKNILRKEIAFSRFDLSEEGYTEDLPIDESDLEPVE